MGDCDTDTEAEEWINAFIQATCGFRHNGERGWKEAAPQLMPGGWGPFLSSARSVLQNRGSGTGAVLPRPHPRSSG